MKFVRFIRSLFEILFKTDFDLISGYDAINEIIARNFTYICYLKLTPTFRSTISE